MFCRKKKYISLMSQFIIAINTSFVFLFFSKERKKKSQILQNSSQSTECNHKITFSFLQLFNQIFSINPFNIGPRATCTGVHKNTFKVYSREQTTLFTVFISEISGL